MWYCTLGTLVSTTGRVGKDTFLVLNEVVVFLGAQEDQNIPPNGLTMGSESPTFLIIS